MAAFGNAVVDFQNVAQSTIGYVMAIDLGTNRLRKITQVQVQDVALNFSVPVVSEVTLDVLLGYLNSTSAPPIAISQVSTTLYVFLNQTQFPIINPNRIGMFYDTNAIPIAAPTETLKIPQEARNLLKAIVLKTMKYNAENRVELDVSQAVVREKAILGLQ
jgi:hypothetical protein